MNQIEITQDEVAERNLAAFHTFLKNLTNPVYISNREVLIGASVIYYEHKKMHQFTAAVVLIQQGPEEGSIRIVQRDVEGIDMDMSLSIHDGIFSPGRINDVLTIENIPGNIRRIDLTENSMIMKGLN